MGKFRVYLAGPISDCNDDQKIKWRNEVKKQYSGSFDFSDPIDNLLPKNATNSDIIKEDIRAIEESDGVIVNMWRESVGSAMGMIHAHIAGKPVVVSNPSFIGSKALEFYSDALTNTPLKAAKILKNILEAESKLKVLKRHEAGQEPFSRRKLVNSLRNFCRDVKKDDVLVPRIATPIVIDKLISRTKGNQVTTTEISSIVLESFQDLEADPGTSEIVAGVSDEWETHDPSSPIPGNNPEPEVDFPAYEDKVNVPVASTDSHGTIWGNTITAIDQLPQQVRPIFDCIVNVHGITRIRLAQFGRGQERNTVCAFVSASKTDNLLDGKVFDRGIKGSVQEFQIWVQHNSRKTSVLNHIRTTLLEEDLWRE